MGKGDGHKDIPGLNVNLKLTPVGSSELFSGGGGSGGGGDTPDYDGIDSATQHTDEKGDREGRSGNDAPDYDGIDGVTQETDEKYEGEGEDGSEGEGRYHEV